MMNLPEVETGLRKLLSLGRVVRRGVLNIFYLTYLALVGMCLSLVAAVLIYLLGLLRLLRFLMTGTGVLLIFIVAYVLLLFLIGYVSGSN
jgi:hypothetical protein